MNASAEVLPRSEVVETSAAETTLPRAENACDKNAWSATDFAREQIRGLVRVVFFAGSAPPVKQVVFSSAEVRVDVGYLCDQVARSLALETKADVALVECEPSPAGAGNIRVLCKDRAPIKPGATQITTNLWRVPASTLGECSHTAGTGPYWTSCLAQLRSEFEYLVIQGPAAGISSEAALLGQFTDGIVLVLGAHSTRRASARRIKETLEAAGSRILGTVLSERRFPIPERIYRRL
jgi:hypothetical protein